MVNLTKIRAPLFVPANRPERFAKAAASGADAVILDLEDAVGPDDKEAARASLDTNFTEQPVIVRINAIGTPWHAGDLAIVSALRPTAVMIPKAEDAATITAVGAACRLPVIALIETARGLGHARAISAAESVARLAFGSIDFCADLGCGHLRQILLPARTELVLASRLAEIAPPLDGVTSEIDDLALTYDDAAHARALGMTGKLCIHPKQIAEVKRAFAPHDREIAWARRVLASGSGAVAVDGAMVDEPVRVRARALLEQLGS